MSGLQSKTPVSVLQELLSRRGTTPKYELVQIEGAIHEPTFRYRVTVSDVVASGTGRSKKEAKHAAAKAILDKLIGTQVAEGTNSTGQNNTTEVSTQIISPYDDKIPGNPIGSLQEMCMARRWPPPTYDLMSEEGLPHERQFTIACIVSKYKETGAGKSKKLAKRQAAFKMLQRLKDTPVEPGTMPTTLDEDDELRGTIYESYLKTRSLSALSSAETNHDSDVMDELKAVMTLAARIASRFSELKETKITTLSPPHSQKVSQFHRTLKTSTGEKLNELQKIALNVTDFNCVQFLHEIATEQNFEVTYVDIEEVSLSKNRQCLVQLSTFPVAVCYGAGVTSEDAQSAAALNALEYLKIMTKK